VRSLWAAELVNSYAPELTITAVLASAPGGDLVSQARALDKDTTLPASRNLELLIRSWQAVYRLPVETIMDAEQAKILPEADDSCLSGLTGVKVKAGFASDPDWAPRLEQNSPAGRHIDAPILYLQGTADEQIPIAAARTGRDRLCADGDVIEYREFDGEDHNSPLLSHEDDAVAWVKDRAAGDPARNPCT
jgi:Dipeptidyl aminopeptidases/acylaminoacyl-peptidases